LLKSGETTATVKTSSVAAGHAYIPKDTNINKEYKIEKIGSIFFEKKGFDIFVPNI